MIDKQRAIELKEQGLTNKQVAQEFFSVNPSEIVDIATEGGERFIQKWINKHRAS